MTSETSLEVADGGTPPKLAEMLAKECLEDGSELWFCQLLPESSESSEESLLAFLAGWFEEAVARAGATWKAENDRLRAQLAGDASEHEKLAQAADDLLEAAAANGYDRPLRDFYMPLGLSRLAAWFRQRMAQRPSRLAPPPVGSRWTNDNEEQAVYVLASTGPGVRLVLPGSTDDNMLDAQVSWDTFERYWRRVPEESSHPR